MYDKSTNFLKINFIFGEYFLRILKQEEEFTFDGSR